MRIGRPRRRYTIEPIESPVPDRREAPEPAAPVKSPTEAGSPES